MWNVEATAEDYLWSIIELFDTPSIQIQSKEASDPHKMFLCR